MSAIRKPRQASVGAILEGSGPEVASGATTTTEAPVAGRGAQFAQYDRTFGLGRVAYTTRRAMVEGWRPMAKTDGQNARLHHMARARHVAAVRERVGAALAKAYWPRSLKGPPPDWRVTFRVYQRRGPLPDTDAQVGMLKACRDAVAAYLEVDDDERGPRWAYLPWERSRWKDSVEIILEHAGNSCPMCGRSDGGEARRD